MSKISAVLMTLNEERDIGRCLASLQGISDEIVVVDSFSTDRTEEICLQYGARFIKHPFEGYIEQRAYSISQAAYDHVLVMDADEELSRELRNSILAVKENWTHDGYYFNRMANYCGQWIRHCHWYPDRKLRLFDRRKASVKGKNPHDEVMMHTGVATKNLKGDLLHYTCYTVDEHIHQINRFTGIQAQNLFRQKKRYGYLMMIFSPMYKFIRNYIFYRGFLDGYFGYLICRNAAYSTFLKYAKLKALYKSSEF
ncbi:MAG: glycosyltransferase family 2 protein [Bacteroidales bacterium]